MKLSDVRPTYNHTRGDSRLTPCVECQQVTYLLSLIRRMRPLLVDYRKHLLIFDDIVHTTNLDRLLKETEE